MRIFRSKGVTRFARREHISDTSLRIAIERAAQGIIDADLSGGLIKQRVSRAGQGRSRGFRMIIAYRKNNRAVFLYGFAKNDRSDINDNELQTLRILGENWLAASDDTLVQALIEGDLQEIQNDHSPKN